MLPRMKNSFSMFVDFFAMVDNRKLWKKEKVRLESITPPCHLPLPFDPAIHFRKIDMTIKNSGGFIRFSLIVRGDMMLWSILIYISRTRFSPHLEVCSNIANNMNFHVRPIWKKPTHLHIALYHHAKFQKKLMSQFQ